MQVHHLRNLPGFLEPFWKLLPGMDRSRSVSEWIHEGDPGGNPLQSRNTSEPVSFLWPIEIGATKDRLSRRLRFVGLNAIDNQNHKSCRLLL